VFTHPHCGRAFAGEASHCECVCTPCRRPSFARQCSGRGHGPLEPARLSLPAPAQGGLRRRRTSADPGAGQWIGRGPLELGYVALHQSSSSPLHPPPVHAVGGGANHLNSARVYTSRGRASSPKARRSRGTSDRYTLSILSFHPSLRNPPPGHVPRHGCRSPIDLFTHPLTPLAAASRLDPPDRQPYPSP
jgi:hypothetical protein